MIGRREVSDLPELEDARKNLDEAIDRVIAAGRGDFADFDDRVNAAVNKGTLALDKGLTRALPGISNESAALIYLISTDDELAERLQGMSETDAIAYLLRNQDALLKRIDLGNTTMAGYEKHRRLQGARY